MSLTALSVVSRPDTPDSANELHVPGEDSHTLSIDRTDVCVFEHTHNVSFCGLLQRQQGIGRDAQARVVDIRDQLAHEALEWEFLDQELICALKLSDLDDCPGARPILMRFLSTWHPLARNRV